jgi:hypothetical protein
LDDGVDNTPEDYRRFALQGYDVEMSPFGFGARVGFALNFN